MDAVEPVRLAKEVGRGLRRTADARELGNGVRRNREFPERLDDGGGDGVVPASRAECRDGPFVIAPRQADRVLLERRVVNLGFGDVRHAAFSSFAFTPSITW